MEKSNTGIKKLPLIPIALFCCAMWGSAPPFIKWGYEALNISDTGSILLFAGVRFFLAGIMVLVIALCSHNPEVKKPQTYLIPVLWLALFQTAGQYFFYYVGLAHASAVMGAILSSASGFFALILSAWIFRREKMRGKKMLGMILGITGIILLNLKGLQFNFSLAGEGALVLSQLSAAISTVLIQIFSQKHNPVALSGWQFTVGGLVLAAAGVLMGAHIAWNLKGILIMLWLAFVSAAAYTLWSMLLKEYPVSSVSVFTASIPLFGIVFSLILLPESSSLNWNTLLALVFVTMGVLIMNFRKTKV